MPPGCKRIPGLIGRNVQARGDGSSYCWQDVCSGLLQEECALSFVNGMISSFIKGMTPEQKQQLLRDSVEQVIASTSSEERAQLLAEVTRRLVESLSPEQRARLAQDLAVEIGR